MEATIDTPLPPIAATRAPKLVPVINTEARIVQLACYKRAGEKKSDDKERLVVTRGTTTIALLPGLSWHFDVDLGAAGVGGKHCPLRASGGKQRMQDPLAMYDGEAITLVGKTARSELPQWLKIESRSSVRAAISQRMASRPAVGESEGGPITVPPGGDAEGLTEE